MIIPSFFPHNHNLILFDVTTDSLCYMSIEVFWLVFVYVFSFKIQSTRLEDVQSSIHSWGQWINHIINSQFIDILYDLLMTFLTWTTIRVSIPITLTKNSSMRWSIKYVKYIFDDTRVPRPTKSAYLIHPVKDSFRWVSSTICF